MSDFDTGAAAAATDSTPAPVVDNSQADNVVDTPNPRATSDVGQPVEEKKPVSTREALEKATAKVKADAADAKSKEPAAEKKPIDAKAEKAPVSAEPRPKEPAKPVQSQPVQDEQKSASRTTAPERFSPDAKAAWEAAPEPIKAEVHRAIRELEQGHGKYKADAEAYSQVREVDTLAKQHGTSIKNVMDQYVGLERGLTSQDGQTKAQTITHVLQYAGLTPHQYASWVLGQPQEQRQSQNDATVMSLQQELAGLKQQLGGVTTTIQDQRQNAILQDLAEFAKAHPRFDELGDTIAKLIDTGMAADVNEAYEMANRLNPGAAPSAAQARSELGLGQTSDNTDDLKAQTLKGSKSVNGAPSAGSNPASKGKPSSSIRESLKRAAAAAG